MALLSVLLQVHREGLPSPETPGLTPEGKSFSRAYQRGPEAHVSPATASQQAHDVERVRGDLRGSWGCQDRMTLEGSTLSPQAPLWCEGVGRRVEAPHTNLRAPDHVDPQHDHDEHSVSNGEENGP